MIDRVKLSLDKSFTCPAKTLAIFAHSEDFDYLPDARPPVVSAINSCKSIDQVFSLIKEGELPQTVSSWPGDSCNAVQASLGDIVIFNTRAQRNSKVKLLLWLSLPRHGKQSINKQFEIVLPHRVAARYITTSFIESENYLRDFNDFEHPNPNVDIQELVFKGSQFKIPPMLR